MIVYCDTSFLVSFLNEDDVNHKPARNSAEKWDTHDFVVCEVHLLELPAPSGRHSRADDTIPAHIARRIINRI
jgi:predicted nucleic acid-binding protein